MPLGDGTKATPLSGVNCSEIKCPNRFNSVNRFGSSDCYCNSHLFFEEINARAD